MLVDHIAYFYFYLNPFVVFYDHFNDPVEMSPSNLVSLGWDFGLIASKFCDTCNGQLSTLLVFV